jgi:hypothetical protein
MRLAAFLLLAACSAHATDAFNAAESAAANNDFKRARALYAEARRAIRIRGLVIGRRSLGRI